MFLGKTETFTGRFGEFGPPFPVTGGRSGNLRDTFTNQRFGLDQLGFSIAASLRILDSLMQRLEIMSVHPNGVPTEGIEAFARIVALRYRGHSVEGDVV